MPSRIINAEVEGFLRENANLVRGLVVDVGCGEKPFRRVVSAERYIGVDLDPDVHPDVVASATDLPLESESADCVLCLSVLGEIDDPHAAFSEFARVLRSGASLLVVSSQNWRELEADDYFRFTGRGLRLLAERAGLAVVLAEGRRGFLAQLAAKLDTYLLEVTPSSLRRAVSLMVRPWTSLALAFDRHAPYRRDPLLVTLVARKP